MKLRLAKIAAVIAGRCGRRYASLLWLYVDGQLNDEQRAYIESHLESCALCRAEYEALRFSNEQIAQLQLPEEVPIQFPLWLKEQKFTNQEKRRSVLRPRWVIATAALLILAGTLAWYMRRPPVVSWDVTRLAGMPKVRAGIISTTSPISVGDWLETDAVSRAMIRVGAIGYVEVDAGSRLQLLTARANEHRLSLVRGKMHASILAPPREGSKWPYGRD